MAKFDRMIKKFNSPDYLCVEEVDDGIASLYEIKAALVEGIAHFSDQEKLNNIKEVWYSNAKDSYEEKLEKVNIAIIQLEARRVSLSTPPISYKA